MESVVGAQNRCYRIRQAASLRIQPNELRTAIVWKSLFEGKLSGPEMLPARVKHVRHRSTTIAQTMRI